MESVVSRRGILTGIGASAAAAGLGIAAGDAEAAQPTVRGTWLIRPKSSGGPAGFRALAAFAAGGVFVTTGSDEPGTGLGEWSSEGSNGFAFTYLNFHFDRHGNLADTVKVRARGTFHGTRMSGHATERTVDAQGRGAPPRPFEFTGRRVEVELP